MSLKLIDPNRINQGSSVQPEDLCIDLQLTAYRKGKTVLLGEGNKLTTKQEETSFIDLTSGTNIGGNQLLTTMYTEIGSSYDVIGDDNTYATLEALGITSVDIDFNASNVPVVKMTLTDVRGRLFQQGNESPYSIFFQFPYPLFKLKAKGLFGKSISYDLHLVKFNTQFNSDFGGFEINCEFIGYTYAYLSDLLIGYTRAVPYTTIGSELSKDLTISFSEYQNKAFQLAELARNYMVNQTSSVIEQQKTEASNYEALLESFKSSVNEFKANGSRIIESSSDGIFLISQRSDKDIKEDESGIKNLNDLFTTKLNTDFKEAKISYEVKTNTSFDLNSKNEYNHTNEMVTIINSFNKNYNGTRKTVTLIDARKFFTNIQNATTTLRSDIVTNTEEQVSGFSQALLNSDLNPSIGDYFKVICTHADLLWSSIHKIAENILGDDGRNNQFSDIEGFGDSTENPGKTNPKILPFPDVKKLENGMWVDDWIGNKAAGGSNIPEGVFVEELIQGFLKAYKELKELEDKLNSFENDQSAAEASTGTVPFIPIHPMDGPAGGGNTVNPYDDVIDYDKLIVRLGNRICGFIALQNINPHDKTKFLGKEALISLCDAEFYNIKTALKNKKNLSDLLQTKCNQIETDVTFFDIKMTDGKKTQFMADVYAYIIKKMNIIKVGGGLDTKIKYYEFTPGADKNSSQISFGPNRPLIPLALGHGIYENDKLVINRNIPAQNTGKYIEITVEESIDDSGVVLNEELSSLDNVYNYETSDKTKLSKKFGATYIEKASVAEGPLMFYTKNPISIYKESSAMAASFFANNNAPNIFSNNVTEIVNYKNLTKDNKVFQINLGYNLYNDKTKEYSQVKNYRDGITSSELYLSDLPIMINNKIGSLFLDPLYIYQSTEIKAFMFLHSLPFGFNGDSSYSGYFNKNLMSIISDRTKIVKGGYLWCALVGAILKINKLSETDNNYRIYVTRKSIHLTNYKPNSKYVSGSSETNNGDRYLRPIYSIISNNAFKTFKEYGLGIVRNDDEFMEFPSLLLGLPENVKNEFIGIFDQFLAEFKTKILPYSNIFKTYPSGSFDYESSKINLINSGMDINLLRSEYSLLSFVSNYTTSTSQGSPKTMMKVHGNVAKFKYNSTISKNITELSKKVAFMSIGHGSLFTPGQLVANKLLNYIPYNTMYDSFGTLCEMFSNGITNSITENEELLSEVKSLIGLNDSEDIRIKVYKDIKSIYEKWVNGDTSYKNLYEKFKFQNRHYKDISNEFKINPINMIKDLMGNLHQPLIAHISKVLTNNNFQFLPTPSYINIHDMKEMTDVFKPFRWNESVTAVESMFVCMYIGEYSSKLDLNGTDNYRSDGIKLSIDDSATSPEITQISAPDFNTGEYDIPIIRVKYGDQNQSIFTKFGLDQSEFTITNESLVVTDDLTKNNGLSQNLYDIYVSRSYTLNLELLGNFMVQPFMYLYLENIPMFFGLYYIIKVSHKISANTAFTTIKAVRMRQTMTKMLDEESLYYSLFAIFKDAQIGGSGSSSGGGGVLTGKIKIKNGKTAEVNKAYVDKFQNFINELETFYEIREIGGYSFRQNVNDRSKLSFHSWGAAIDINPSENPNQTTKTDMPVEKVRALAKKHGLGWGYDWKTVKDPMHFSVAKKEGGSEDILADGTNVPNKINSGNGSTGEIIGTTGVSAGLSKFKPASRSYENALNWVGKITTPGLDKNVKAFLDVIAFAEGTIGQSNNGYDYLIGDRIITGWTPTTNINHGGKSWYYMSTATGRYQFLIGTWTEVCKGNAPLTAANQDNACAKKLLARLKNVSLKSMENKNTFISVIKGSGKKSPLENEWESFYKSNNTSKTDNRNLNKLYDLYIYALSKY